MNIDKLSASKFIVVFLYSAFCLNLISIFYMDRANNQINDSIEFYAPILFALVIASLTAAFTQKIDGRKILWAAIGFIVGAPIVFFAHVVYTL